MIRPETLRHEQGSMTNDKSETEMAERSRENAGRFHPLR
jgi:hypothetical protein